MNKVLAKASFLNKECSTFDTWVSSLSSQSCDSLDFFFLHKKKLPGVLLSLNGSALTEPASRARGIAAVSKNTPISTGLTFSFKKANSK